MSDQLLTEEARGWIGRAYPEQEFTATRDSIRRFAYATRETNPIHFDRDAARAAGYPDVIAPPMYYTVLRTAPYHTVPLDALGKDGFTEGDLPPIAFTRGMAGESQVRWHAHIVAGDLMRTRKKLADIYEPHDARLWLFARQRLLDDQVPAELIQQGRVDEVLASVNQLLDGVHL